MPTEFIGQNGAAVTQTTHIAVSGCAKHKSLTRAQKLARALKACQHKPHAKRAACKRAARRRYGHTKKTKH